MRQVSLALAERLSDNPEDRAGSITRTISRSTAHTGYQGLQGVTGYQGIAGPQGVTGHGAAQGTMVAPAVRFDSSVIVVDGVGSDGRYYAKEIIGGSNSISRYDIVKENPE